jgi:hypothetical protein
MADCDRGGTVALDLDSDEIHLEDVLAEHLRVALEGVQTALPGVVVRADLERQRLDVRPTGGRVVVHPDTGAESYRRYSVIEGVPIAYPQSRAGGITFPVDVGDEVLLVFGSHSLDSWLGGRDGDSPADDRRHHLTDAIAIPGVGRRPVLPASARATVVHGADVRIGGADATSRAARDVDLQALRSLILAAPDGVGFGSSLKASITSSGWPSCASTVRLR